MRDLHARFGDDRAPIYVDVERVVEQGQFRRERKAGDQSLWLYVEFLSARAKRNGWISIARVMK